MQLVNAVAPFVLNARLKPLMLRTPDRDKHIVNVSAVEGQFYRRFKTTRHPHTNMAKAALNMMTRTSATDYHGDGIHMNSVDTGWVTDEDPLHIAEQKTAEHRFQPPLDIVDGAARIVDPIIDGMNTGDAHLGQVPQGLQADGLVAPLPCDHDSPNIDSCARRGGREPRRCRDRPRPPDRRARDLGCRGPTAPRGEAETEALADNIQRVVVLAVPVIRTVARGARFTRVPWVMVASTTVSMGIAVRTGVRELQVLAALVAHRLETAHGRPADPALVKRVAVDLYLDPKQRPRPPRRPAPPRRG